VLVTPQRLPNPALVGKSAVFIAGKCGITVPAETRLLLAPLDGVGRDYPLSVEKLCPVLSYYVVKDWREGCERCKQILRYGGMGHTMSIHSQNDHVILEFGLHKPAFRIVVNSPTTHGSVGLSTGLDPAMTLGCGGYGGNITSDNISPRHLLNIKRLAYEVSPVVSRWDRIGTSPPNTLPSAPTRPAPPTGISADALSRRIDQFLGSRGFKPESATERERSGDGAVSVPTPSPSQPPMDFVCEEDVREAIQTGRKLVVAERAIVTPAARDLGEQHRVFTVAPWRG
jgi:acetaldehyde dehydrogenase (acetylating)